MTHQFHYTRQCPELDQPPFLTASFGQTTPVEFSPSSHSENVTLRIVGSLHRFRRLYVVQTAGDWYARGLCFSPQEPEKRRPFCIKKK